MDSDDGNAVLRTRARRALENWQNFLSSIVAQGIKKGEIRRQVSKTKLANLMIATLEGAVMIGRLEESLEALRDAQTHLNNYLETKVRATN